MLPQHAYKAVKQRAGNQADQASASNVLNGQTIRSEKPLKVFFRALLANPRGVGAACPSSKGLARKMASFISAKSQGYVIELGAGTGVVTEAILARGIDPDRLIVVEKSPRLVAYLQHRFPHIHVIHGDAAHLTHHLKSALGQDSIPVSAIVSSLPLRSLPNSLVRDIKAQFDALLPHSGKLIQFTYALRPFSHRYPGAFHPVKTRYQWFNIPPARVEVYARRAHA